MGSAAGKALIRACAAARFCVSARSYARAERSAPHPRSFFARARFRPPSQLMTQRGWSIPASRTYYAPTALGPKRWRGENSGERAASGVFVWRGDDQTCASRSILEANAPFGPWISGPPLRDKRAAFWTLLPKKKTLFSACGARRRSTPHAAQVPGPATKQTPPRCCALGTRA